MLPPSRHRRYDDPLDLIWRRAADQLGWTVRQDPEVFASWDGRGTLSVCPPSAYDPDDSLAQLVFHEICHALVQGRKNLRKVDWGLHNQTPTSDALAEHACHRLQAALLDRWGLRDLLGVTTDWRPYWDALPEDPLAPCDDPALEPAQRAWVEAVRGPWAAVIEEALSATAALAAVLRTVAPEDSLWSTPLPLHPHTHLPLGPSGTCGGCTWFTEDARCRLTDRPTSGEAPACRRHEQLDLAACRACGACCREGFHLVGVEPDEPFAQTHPELLVTDDHGHHVPRPGGRCVALEPTAPPWTCRHYAERPRACADFELGGPHCLAARQRVGVTRR